MINEALFESWKKTLSLGWLYGVVIFLIGAFVFNETSDLTGTYFALLFALFGMIALVVLGLMLDVVWYYAKVFFGREELPIY